MTSDVGIKLMYLLSATIFQLRGCVICVNVWDIVFLELKTNIK